MAAPLALISRLLTGAASLTRRVGAMARLSGFRRAKKALDKFDDATTHHGVRIYVDRQKLSESLGYSAGQIDLFYAYTKAEIFIMMKEEMGAFSGFCAERTPPLDAGGLQVGKDRVERDVHRAFIPLHNIKFASLVLAQNWSLVDAYEYEFSSARYNKWLKNKEYDKIYRVFTNPNLFYNRSEGRPVPYVGGGKLTKEVTDTLFNRAKNSKTRMRNGTTFLVAGADAKEKIKAYIKLVQQRVGKMANGWVVCYYKLKGKGYNLPPLMKNASAGIVEESEQLVHGEPMHVSISNKYGNVNDWMYESKGSECKDQLSNPICQKLQKMSIDTFKRNKQRYLQ